ncbi:MAG: SpoIIIAH-like family protein [Clostridia bacterium]|nr:SpoIIIAH-like family protein [Clostridia bacterium]
MKKGKVFSKGHIIAGLMVIALGAAIWLNVKFTSSEKYLGEVTYVDNNTDTAVQTSAKTSSGTNDYFAEAKKERENSIKEAQEIIEETLKSDNLSDEEKQDAVNKTNQLAAKIEQANNIETLLKAKGFEKAVAVLGDKSINIVVKSDGLTTAQTLQIQDIVTAETDISLSNIKIVTVK